MKNKLLPLLFLIIVIFPATAFSANSKNKKPNILLILVDDAGMHDLSPFTGHDMPTPNLQAFAGSAVKFTRFYADATCQPARAALLTGLYAPHLGMSPAGRGIPKQVKTIADRLDKVGYTTYHVGKWHLDWQNREAWPGAEGFDHWFGFLSQWLLKGPGPQGKMINQWPPTYYNPWLQKDGGPMKQYKGQLTDILAAHVKKLLQNPGKKPWFINYWTYAPHTPYQPDKKYGKRFSKSVAGRYKALIAQLDGKVGMLVRTLKKTGQYKNTLIIFASDNGGPDDARDNNYPYYGKKATYTEGGLRTPAMIHWPSGAGAGTTTNAVVDLRDLTATVAAVGGASTQGIKGHDLTVFAHGRKKGWKRPLFWEESYGVYGLSFGVLSANGRWRLVGGRKNKLYDLKNNPAGSYNVADIHPDEVKRLLSLFHKWHNRMRVMDTHYKKLNYGGVVRGDDLLRTPGREAYTFGIGIDPAKDIETTQIIAQQLHVWSLKRKGRSINLQIGKAHWHGVLPSDYGKRGCIPVVWTGLFHHNNGLNKKSTARAALYIDGKKIQSKQYPYPAKIKQNLHQPTWIGRNDSGKQRFDGKLGTPIFLKDYVFDNASYAKPSAAKFSASLCKTGSGI